MSSPWLKFYPTDWRADPALRTCSIAARGLWVELLCVMHEAEPYGSLRVNGTPVSERKIAGLAGVSIDEAISLLNELEEAGVFSRDEAGAIVSRRMQRDKAKADADKANGKRGGNPKITDGVNPQDKGEDKAQKPETRDQKEEAGASSKTRTSDEFEIWYRLYPHKVQRGTAERAFAAARKIASLDELVAGLRNYLGSKPADYAWRNPATWLNGKGWLDEPADRPQPRTTGPPAKPRNAGELALMRLNGTYPHEPPDKDTRRLDLGDGRGQAEDLGDVLRPAFGAKHFPGTG